MVIATTALLENRVEMVGGGEQGPRICVVLPPPSEARAGGWVISEDDERELEALAV